MFRLKGNNLISKVFIGIIIFVCFPMLTIANDYKTNTLVRDKQSSITYYFDPAILGKRSKELLLILHGSDCNSVRNIKSVYEVLRNVRPEADLVTIEKYGIDSSLHYSKKPDRTDCPKLYIQRDSPELRSKDAIQVLKSILHKYEYDSVILLGGSEGAFVANLITAQVNFIHASIVFNGGGRWFIDDVLHNVRITSNSVEEAQESVNGLKGFTKQILTNEEFNIEVSGHGYNWWRSALELDQTALLKKTTSPILLIQSEKDQSVSPILVDEMVNELEKTGSKNITYLKYSSLDHGLRDNNGVSRMKQVVKDIKVWLEDTLRLDK